MQNARHGFANQHILVTIFSLGLMASLGTGAWGATTILLQDLSGPGPSQAAPQVADADELRVAGVPLDVGAADATLTLRPLQVFSDDARVTIQTATGEVEQPAPRHRYFGGTVEGRPASHALLTLLEGGGVRGLVHDGDSWWRIGEVAEEASGIRRIEVRRVGPGTEDRPFHCANGDLPDDLQSLLGHMEHSADAGQDAAGHAVPQKGVLPTYTAHIAFETDQEYLALFGGDTTAATDYVGDLVALGSLIYTDEVDTSWIVVSVNLWTTTDPWSQSPGTCALLEFGKYWNDTNGAIVRTIAHMLSGKAADSGVAWVGVLCSSSFTYDATGLGCGFSGVSNYGGAYGFTGGIDGNLDIGSPAPLWDSVAVLHEIGHNFNSPHTHCYNGIGGSASPIDMCYSGQSGCYTGATSLPAGCPGAGSNCGTIMSYCHLLSGGISGNMSLTLGTSWGYGVLPDRVPARMSAHVVSEAAMNPGCLDFELAGAIFDDGFESGDTTRWSSTVN